MSKSCLIPFIENWTIKVKKIPRYEEFEGEFTEPLDYHLLSMIHESSDPRITKPMKTMLKNTILNNINTTTGELKVVHNNSKHNMGRFYCNNNVSIIPHSRFIKHTVFSYMGWSDLDMVKGHTTIAVEMWKTLKLPTQLSHFQYYIDNFETIAKEFIDYYNPVEGLKLESDDIKHLFVLMIYGGGFNTWKESLIKGNENKNIPPRYINNSDKLLDFGIYFKAECDTVAKRIVKQNPCLLKKFKEVGESSSETNNRVVSYWYTTIENHVVHLAYQYLVLHRIIKPKRCGLEMDGINVPPAQFDKIVTVSEINRLILTNTGLTITMKFKEYGDRVLQDIIEQRKKLVIADVVATDCPEIADEIDDEHESLLEYISQDMIDLVEHNNDYDVAKVMYKIYGENFACACVKKESWYHFNNHKWTECDGGYTLREIISNEFRTLVVEAKKKVSNGKSPAFKRATIKLVDLIDKLSSSSMKRCIMLGLADIAYKVKFIERLDTNPKLLCCSNGIFDFTLKKMRDGTPEDMCSLCTNIPYLEPNECNKADIEALTIFLEQIFPFDDQRRYMQEHLASSLLGKVAGDQVNQTFNNYIGIGANGKSTLCALAKCVFGDYCGDVAVSLITQKRPVIGCASPEIYALRGLRYAVIQEPQKGDVINEGIVKQLTGGDPLTGRKLFGDLVTFTAMFNLVVCTNNAFTVKSNDNGTWRRMRLVNFPSVFKDEPDVTNPLEFPTKKLNLDAMAIPLLCFLVSIALETNGKVSECDIITTATNSYRVKEDKIGQFMLECIIPCPDSKVSKSQLNTVCSDWFETNYRYRINNRILFDELDKIYECISGNYYGLKLNCGDEKIVILTKEQIFIEAFNKRFEVTRFACDYINSKRICEWAKESNLKVDTSMGINPILMANYKLDVNDTAHYKNKKIEGVQTRCWIGIKEKTD